MTATHRGPDASFGLNLVPTGTGRSHARMIVIVSSRHMEVTPALKAHAEQKANKLLKYYDRIQEIEVIFDAGKDQIRVEMIVNAEHKNMFIAHHDEGDAYACVDACAQKLERQLSEHKKKFRNRKHPVE
jgi:putative sigma-54 modulation protein